MFICFWSLLRVFRFFRLRFELVSHHARPWVEFVSAAHIVGQEHNRGWYGLGFRVRVRRDIEGVIHTKIGFYLVGWRFKILCSLLSFLGCFTFMLMWHRWPSLLIITYNIADLRADIQQLVQKGQFLILLRTCSSSDRTGVFSEAPGLQHFSATPSLPSLLGLKQTATKDNTPKSHSLKLEGLSVTTGLDMDPFTLVELSVYYCGTSQNGFSEHGFSEHAGSNASPPQT